MFPCEGNRKPKTKKKIFPKKKRKNSLGCRVPKKSICNKKINTQISHFEAKIFSILLFAFFPFQMPAWCVCMVSLGADYVKIDVARFRMVSKGVPGMKWRCKIEIQDIRKVYRKFIPVCLLSPLPRVRWGQEKEKERKWGSESPQAKSPSM